MLDPNIMLSAASLFVTLAGIAAGTITSITNTIKADRKHLIALREEVRDNLYILSKLKTNDTSANAVYADGVIKLAQGLRCSELQYARDCFDRLLGKKYRRAAVSRPNAKTVDAFYGNLSSACGKLEDIAKRLPLIQGKRTAKTPRFYLKRRIDALITHLSALDAALKIVPTSKRKQGNTSKARGVASGPQR
jgi:hypothetical protein